MCEVTFSHGKCADTGCCTTIAPNLAQQACRQTDLYGHVDRARTQRAEVSNQTREHKPEMAVCRLLIGWANGMGSRGKVPEGSRA